MQRFSLLPVVCWKILTKLVNVFNQNGTWLASFQMGAWVSAGTGYQSYLSSEWDKVLYWDDAHTVQDLKFKGLVCNTETMVIY